jgi:cytochrome P450
MTGITIDFDDIEYSVNPWRLYERLREESPAHHVPGGMWDGGDFYILSRYDDVTIAVREKRLFSCYIRRADYLDIPWLANRDAPEHTRLRHIFNTALNARPVRSLRDWVQQIVDDLVAEVLAAERIEFVEEFASALPLRIVGEMLGVPIDRKADLRRWSQAVMDSFAVAAGMDPDLAPGFFEDIVEFGNYIDELARERQDRPGREDVLGELVIQHEAGEITRDELVAMGMLVVAGSHEAMANLLGGGIHLLLTDAALARRLLAEPDRTGDFIEEYVRLMSPFMWTLRRAVDDIVLHGVAIPRGGLIHAMLGSANRDPRKFPNPDAFDLDRPNKRAHLAFGAGSHSCSGAPLSRLLADVAFRSLYPHLDRLSVDPGDPPRWQTGLGAYGPSRLSIVVAS